MSEHIIRINPDGSMAFLHEDSITQTLKSEGDINIKRASDVSYDNRAHGWRVYIPGTKTQLFEGLFTTRAEALATEKEYLEDRL
jgi:hypothetical protein